jgi:hypothetical protein
MANDTTNQRGLGNGVVYENIDTAKTLTAADNGIVQNVIADAITITLPATGAGLYSFTIRNGGVPASSSVGAGTGSDASALITVAPNASDKITGLNIATPTDNKAILNTKATAKVGDFITLIPDAGDGWIVAAARGIWVSA